MEPTRRNKIMIEKFITIKNVGKFRDCSASGDVALRRLNLVYAENGRGKTTLCALLRSLQSGAPAAIMERKPLAGTGDPSVRVLHAGQAVTFANGAWSQAVPELAIFDSAKNNLDQYCADVLEAYQEGINAYLSQFGTGFRIANSRHNYRGGTPSSTYQLSINEQTIDLGSSSGSAGAPCFRTALSAGDRSALALAFFLVALDQDEKLSERVVVLDAPFTSLDRFRRECTAQITAKLAGRTKQVLLLSHDAHFLKLVWDKAAPADRKALQIARTGRGSFIAELDLARETAPTYLQHHADLLRFYRDFAGDRLSVAKCIRPFLEGLFRSHFPEHFGGNEWLGDFIEKVRDADSNSGLMHAKSDLDELTAINDYSKRFHHEGGATVVPSDINEDELHNFVRRTLAFAGGC